MALSFARDLSLAAALLTCVQLPVQTAAQVVATPEPFDCDPKFEAIMNPGWAAWCCLNKGFRCPTTTTMTTTTVTTTVTSTTSSSTFTSTTTLSPEE